MSSLKRRFGTLLYIFIGVTATNPEPRVYTTVIQVPDAKEIFEFVE